MKICPVGAALFHANRRTDRRTNMMKPTAAFRSSTNTLTKLNVFLTVHHELPIH